MLDDLLERAYAALESGDTKKARALADDAMRLEPEDRDVILLDVDILLEEAEDDEGLERAITRLEKASECAPDDPVLMAVLGSYLVDYFDGHVDALPLLEEAVRIASEQVPTAPGLAADHRDFLVDLLLLLAECRSVCSDPRGALSAAERAALLDADLGAAHLSVATARFDLCDLEGARAAVMKALSLDPHFPDARWWLGRIETVCGNDAAADRAFAEAAELDGETFHVPTRIEEGELVSMIEEGLAGLPAKVRDYMQNVAIVVEDYPTVARLTDNDPPLSPGSLGLFEGSSPAQESSLDPWATYPRQITLFRKNLEIESRDREQLKELARTTLIHEVGHFLGLDEDDLAERGLS